MNKQQGILVILVFILSVGLVNVAFTNSGDPAMEARLQRMEDIEAIRSLLIDYGQALDSQDIEAYSKLFAEDGVWTGGMGSATGPKAIQKMVEEGIAGMPPGVFDNSNHIMSSMEIEVNGDTATSWSRWTWVIEGPDGKPRTERAGHYEDKLVRVNGQWKFQRREAFTEINK